MKKLLLASAIAALSITSVQAAPQVYGKAFLTLDLQDGDTDTITVANGVSTKTSAPSANNRSQLNSNASRIGFKGSEALTANTDLVYQLEYRVELDEHSSNGRNRNFEARDTYLGLSNKQYGTALAGRLTAIDKMVDYANVSEGGVLGGDVVQASFDAPRANNAFAYVSPNYNGVNFLAMYVLDEDVSTTSATLASSTSPAVAIQANDSLGRDAWGVGAKFEPNNAPYRAGTTYIQAGKQKVIRVSGAYDITPATTIGALYQNHNTGVTGAKKENAFTISANHKVAQTPWTAYGQVDVVDNVGGSKDAERQRLVVGSKYAFNKATTGHLYGAYLKTESYSNRVDAQNYTKTEFDGFGLGAGIEYKF